jgi:hypothetical protein
MSSNSVCHIRSFLGKIRHICNFFPGIVSGENFASKVDFDDDIDNFLTSVNISQSRPVALCKE